jgi:sugar phosphate isomerase/epimerase
MALLGVQLYSLREELKENYAGVIAQLSEMGYNAVETAGYPGSTAEEAKKLYQEHSLKVLSQHTGLPIGDHKNRIIEEAQMLGATYLITGGPHGGWDSYSSLDSLKASADAYLEAAQNAAPHGLKVGHHNHDMEMNELEGKLGIEHFLELTEGKAVWEMDSYWVKVGGQDPADLLKTYGEQIPLIHIKDGPGVKGEPMLAAGKGVMDIASILEAAPHAELLCVELDNCDTDMLKAVDESIAYLRGLI